MCLIDQLTVPLPTRRRRRQKDNNMSNFQIPSVSITGAPADDLRSIDALGAQLTAAQADDRFSALCVEIRLALPKRHVEELRHLIRNGPVWDGDVISKADRDDLLRWKLAARVLVNGQWGYAARGVRTATPRRERKVDAKPVLRPDDPDGVLYEAVCDVMWPGFIHWAWSDAQVRKDFTAATGIAIVERRSGIEGWLHMPVGDGAHARSDARQLGLPLYVTTSDGDAVLWEDTPEPAWGTQRVLRRATRPAAPIQAGAS